MAEFIQGIVNAALMSSGVDVNNPQLQAVLNTSISALLEVPTSVSTPLISDVIGLRAANGSLDLAALNSTSVYNLINDFAPVYSAIPVNATADIFSAVFSYIASSTLLQSLNSLNVSSLLSGAMSGASSAPSLLTTAILPALLSLQQNVTTPLIQHTLEALADVPQSVSNPIIGDLWVALGHAVANTTINATALASQASSLSPLLSSVGSKVLPALTSLPENTTIALLNNTAVGIESLPANESVPVFHELSGLLASVQAGAASAGNSSSSAGVSSLVKPIIAKLYPANGTVTHMGTAILSILTPLTFLAQDNADPGSGTKEATEGAKAIFGDPLPQQVISFTMGNSEAPFGGYPSSADVAPSAIFTAVFAIFAILHLAIFLINYSRGHKFWLSLGYVFYCIMRVIGWVLRIAWSKDVSNTEMGVATETFLIIPTIAMITYNLILAQRLFTWRHPVGGSRRLFWGYMWSNYILVFAFIVLTIFAQSVPYLYYLSRENHKRYRQVVQASSVLLCLYTVVAVNLLALSYFFKPTAKDKACVTYSPWWIERFSPFYFVKKGAEREAQESFLERSHEERSAVRVITATTHHHRSIVGVTTERGDLSHTFSLALVCITSVLILVGSICRTITLFQTKTPNSGAPLLKPVVMYIVWGLFETIINVLYIVGRVDLRFYRPDRLPKHILDAPFAPTPHLAVDGDLHHHHHGAVESHSESSEKDVLGTENDSA